MDMSLAEKIDAVKQETGRGIPTRLGEVFAIKVVDHGHANNPDLPEGKSSYAQYLKAGSGIPDEKILADAEAKLLHSKADAILGLGTNTAASSTPNDIHCHPNRVEI